LPTGKRPDAISKSTVSFIGFACRTAVLSALRRRDRFINGVRQAGRYGAAPAHISNHKKRQDEPVFFIGTGLSTGPG
jgi:hypothetical protein